MGPELILIEYLRAGKSISVLSHLIYFYSDSIW